MMQRTVNVITDVEVDVDIGVDEILEQLDDAELESLGLARVSRGLRPLAEAVWNFHETEHGGLLNGCRHKPCVDFDYDAAELIRKA